MEEMTSIETSEDEQADSSANDALRRPPVRIAIVGLGRAAMHSHLPSIEKLNEFYTITAVCDTIKDRRDIIERKYPDVHTYRHLEDMLDDPDIEAVLVSLPTITHLHTTLDILARDKWAIVETPLAISHDDALMLRAASIKTHGKLIPYTPGLFAQDYRLALMALDDPRLGSIYEIRIRRQDYIRRDDWQAIKRCGGGATNYAALDTILQAVGLLRSPPSQLWSELKRITSLGDAEDFAHIVLKTRNAITADIEINGGTLPPFEPAFTLRGSRGTFSVPANSRSGIFHVIDPAHHFPRRRSSVRTPPFDCDLHESLPIQDIPFALPDGYETGCDVFWRSIFNSIRIAAPPLVPLDDIIEAIRYLHLIKRASPFAN